MTAEAGAKDGQGEPSMEDILASIRRILSDDAGADPAAAPVTASPAATDWEAPAEPVAAPATAPAAQPIRPVASAVVEPLRPRRDDNVFLLTPEMRVALPDPAGVAPQIVSPRTAASGTDVLSQLASAILDRRDIAVGARDITLESMVREMLRPLLREWLDRNLPYLIERLVKREIDLMVNRAERLED